jgi:hypothetical protein
MFFKEVVILHGLPRSIVSNKDTRFVGHFWRNSWKKLGTNLGFLIVSLPPILDIGDHLKEYQN